MSMMDVRQVSMLMLGLRMRVFMRMSNILFIMRMEIFVGVDMFMHLRHVDMKMSMLLVRQQQRRLRRGIEEPRRAVRLDERP